MTKTISLSFWTLALFYIFTLLLEQFLPAVLVLTVLLKATPVLLLLLTIWTNLPGKLRQGMTLAIVFSASGDMLLALDGQATDLFVPGLACFLLAQIIYAVLFWQRAQITSQGVLRATAFTVAALLLAWFILPASGTLLIPVTAYLLAISAMVLGAAFCRYQWLFMGASYFALSDSLIAINKFIQPLPYADALIMLTYYLAQFLIVCGVLKMADRLANGQS